MGHLFYRDRRLLTLAIGLIVVSGLASYSVLPRMEDPELKERAANINTFFPGAEAERVESLVTEKIEDELSEIEEIKEIRSNSRAGVSTLAIELRDDVYDTDPVWSRIRDRLGDVTPDLPPGALPPEFEQLDVRAYALIVSLNWERDDEPNYAILRRLTEELEDRLRSVPGTESVDTFGDPDEEITVRFEPHRLAALGLTSADLAQQIQASDAKISAGQVRGDRYDLLIEVDGELDSLDRIARIPIQSGDRGEFARLADVAEISKGISNPPGSLAMIDGQPAIALGVLVRNDQRLDSWRVNAGKAIEIYRQEIPAGIDLSVVFDQNRYVADRLGGLLFNLMLGASAVTLVILIMMGWRSAIVVATALPLASLMVLSGLRFLEIPIHQMSVTGLIIALGLLIDNAIVIVNEVVHRLRRGAPYREAVGQSVRHLAIPLFGSTLTTALAFAPIALMPGPAGEFVGSIAISVILAIFSSFLLAMTITPALTAITYRWGRGGKARANGLNDPPPVPPHEASWIRRTFSDGIELPTLGRAYSSSIKFVLQRPWVGILIGVAVPLVGFIQSASLPEQFFPPADRDQIQIELELPPEASLQQTIATATDIRESLLTDDRVHRVHWFLGESAPTFYYNLVPRRKGTPRYAQALIELSPDADVRQTIHDLQAQVDMEFPSSRTLVRQLEQGPPFDAPVELRIFGPDLDRLQELGDQVRSVAVSTPRIIHTRCELAERLPKVSFEIDEEAARLAGLDHATIARQLESSLEGAVGGSIVEATEELPVRVRVEDDTRSMIDQIESIDLIAPRSAGSDAANESDLVYQGIPLSTLAGVKVKPEVAGITHLNGRRMNEIQAFVPAGVLPSEVLEDFKRRLPEAVPSFDEETYTFDRGAYTLEFGGEAAKRNDAVGNLMANVGVLIVLMAATLVLSFGSFRIAGLIACVAVLSVGLGFFALWLFGFPFGFMAIVGTMGLIGVAINDAIVVLAEIRANDAARDGDRRAMHAVIRKATRHIIATSLTTMAGFTPLVLGGGGFWPPMAISIAGGVFGATILALYFVPSMYLLLVCRQRVEPVEEQAAEENPTALAAARQLVADAR